jgi:hypothetical protein
LSGDVRVVNSTITRNQAIGDSSEGGGLSGNIEVLNSTVIGNRATIGGGVAGAFGGDIDVRNSIVYGNETLGGEPSDCAPPFTAHGGNLVGEPRDCLLTGDDAVGLDPLLGPLRDNGGPTQTMALAAGSPALGFAVESTATTFDQRGVRRGKDPDAGAYERK